MYLSPRDLKRMRPVAYRAIAIGAILFAAQLAGLGDIPSGPSRPYALAAALAIMALMPAVLWADWSWYSKAGGALLAVWFGTQMWWPDFMPQMQPVFLCAAMGVLLLVLHHEKWRQVLKALAEAPRESASGPEAE